MKASETAAANAQPEKPALWRGVFLVAVVLAIYWPALHGEWLWDDAYEVAENPLLRDPAGLPRIWRGEAALDYFPLKATVQWVLFRGFGAEPFGWHAVSVAMHAVNALLVWGLLRKLELRRAWLAALLFAIHPVAVESVAWIAEFKNTLSLAPALLAFILFVDYDRTQARGRLAWSLACFTAAMLCKSTVAMLPCVLVLYVWWRHRAAAAARARSLIGFFAIAAVLGMVTIWFQHQRAIGGFDIPVGNAAVRVARAGLALSFYVRQLVWPVEVMPVYPRWAVDPPAWWQFLPWIAWAAVGALLWRRRDGEGRPVLFGLGAFVVNLLPILGFVAMAYMHVTWAADHFVYAALPAGAALLVMFIQGIESRLTSRLRVVGGAAVAGYVLCLGALSAVHAARFASPEKLWAYAVRVNPDSPLAQNNLGGVLLRAGDPQGAVARFSRSLELDPRNTGTRINLGQALAATGQLDRALAELQRAVDEQPQSAAALNALAGALLDAGKLEEAEAIFRAVVAARPEFSEAHNNLGIVLARRGDLAGARREFAEALRLDPESAAARLNLARLPAAR
jgi:Flp pilus assembly protein TadD